MSGPIREALERFWVPQNRKATLSLFYLIFLTQTGIHFAWRGTRNFTWRHGPQMAAREFLRIRIILKIFALCKAKSEFHRKGENWHANPAFVSLDSRRFPNHIETSHRGCNTAALRSFTFVARLLAPFGIIIAQFLRTAIVKTLLFVRLAFFDAVGG